MSFSFDPGLSDAVDRIRQRVGQTTSASIIQDETIQAYLDNGKTELGAAAQVARDLAAYWAGQAAQVEVDRQIINTSSRAKTYSDLAIRLEAEDAAAGPVSATAPFAAVIVTGLHDRRPGPCEDAWWPYGGLLNGW